MLTREQILARKTGRGYATLPDGSQVAIRALTRDEVLGSQDLPTLAERDNYIIAAGMTDPKLSVEDVAAWANEGDAGDLVAVSDGIAVLSGLKPGADKEAYKTFRDGPGDGV
jgi:triphosphoribosyl-dephospho-CoA synthetase